MQNFNRKEYPFGFESNIVSESFKRGLTKETILNISKKRNEPKFILDFRLHAFSHWLKMEEPHLENLFYPPLNYQEFCYYSEPKSKTNIEKKQIDPEIIKTMEKLGISLDEQKRLTNIAMDVVIDSVSIGTSFQEKLKASGVILCSISEAIQKSPDLIKKYLASVVPIEDNFFACLNSAVFSDGSFVYIPPNVKCPLELSTYFRIHEKMTGQFERTLIIADENSKVSYLEGCTAPAYTNKQLHAAVVELVALEGAEIKYSTVQNWYPGDPKTGQGGVYNFVTKRGLCEGRESKISWTQVEVGAAITWKYPGTILKGDNSISEFHSVALTNGVMQADTGTKMIHLGKNSRSTIVSKSIAADHSKNAFRSFVYIDEKATQSRNYTECNSLLVSKNAITSTFPKIDLNNCDSQIEHEASTDRLGEEQIYYFAARGIDKEEAMQKIVSGFCDEVIHELPFEFAVESKKLLAMKLEGAIG